MSQENESGSAGKENSQGLVPTTGIFCIYNTNTRSWYI